MTDSFGPIISAGTVEQWIIDLSERWFTEYLADAERKLGYDPRYFPELKEMVRANDFRGWWPEDNLPCLLVMNTGMAREPRRNGDGTWDAFWLFGCSIVVGTPTRQDTRDAMHAYAAAFGQMMLQHRSLEHPEHINGASLIDARPAPLPPRDDRMIGAAQQVFLIEVREFFNERGSPPEPDPRPDPYPPPPALAIVQEGKAGPATIEKKGTQ